MKKVVDASAMRSQKLASFLSASHSHKAVVTDYACMEAFKGNASINLRRSLEILSEFPHQVIILRSTNEISHLNPRSTGLHKRFKDENQTKNFASFCEAVLQGHQNQSLMEFDIRNKEKMSKAHFSRIEADVCLIRKGISQLMESYTKQEIKDLRTCKPISVEFGKRISLDILRITMLHFRNTLKFSRPPKYSDVIYSYPFRYSICCYVQTLWWISSGGHQHVATSKLSNDFTDMSYAAYATFYDGLLTNDKKLDENYILSKWILSNVFEIHR